MPVNWKGILPWVASHILVVLVAGALVYLVMAAAHERELRKRAEAELQKVQTDAAQKRDFQAVMPVSAGKVEAALSPEAKADLAAIRKTVKETSLAVHGLSTVVYGRQEAGTAIPATATTPPMCVDAFNTIKVNTKDCSFTVNREELIETTVARGVDGKTRLVKQTVKELDPTTHLPIPTDPPKVTSAFQFTEEKAPEKTFGLRLLGGIDERLAPGIGLQLAEKWHLAVQATGFYAPKTKDLRGLIGLGWYPQIPFFDSQVALGGGVGLSTKAAGMVYGLHLTVPLGSFTK